MRSDGAPAAAEGIRPTSRPLDWLMLDCYLRRSRVNDPRNATGWAYGLTSTGDRIGVALSAAAASPRPSLLLLDWRPNNNSTKEAGEYEQQLFWNSAKAVAAHRSAILLRFSLPTRGSYHEEEELFVYHAARRPAVPSLTWLPACGHEPHHVTRPIGILSCPDEDVRGGRDFVAAHLTVVAKDAASPLTGELCRMLGREGTWRAAERLSIRLDGGGGGEEDELLRWWATDAVVPVGDSTICWVDYLRGIIFCDDVFSPDELRYVPLPVNPYDGDDDYGEMGGGRNIRPFRNLCVSNDGTDIKFVDVASCTFWFYGAPDYSRRIAAITSWTLSGDRRTWVEDGRIDVADFFDLATRHGLPRVLPKFPLLDVHDPQTIYVALNEEGSSASVRADDKTFVVAVDMRSKTISACVPFRRVFYDSRGGKEGGGDGTTSRNLSKNEPFLPCEFSEYMGLLAVPADDDSRRMTPPSTSIRDGVSSERRCCASGLPAGKSSLNVIKFGSVCFDEICSKEEQAALAARSKLIFGGPARLREEEKKKPSVIQIGTMAVEVKRDVPGFLSRFPLYQKPIMRLG